MKKLFTLFAAVLFAVNLFADLNSYVYGAWDSWENQTNLVSTDGGETYSATVEISPAGTYQFAIIYYSTTTLITRDNNTVVFSGSTGNSQIEADVAGEYTFTLTLETREVVVTYPAKEATALDNANANANAVKRIVNGMLLIERGNRTYTLTGQAVK